MKKLVPQINMPPEIQLKFLLKFICHFSRHTQLFQPSLLTVYMKYRKRLLVRAVVHSTSFSYILSKEHEVSEVLCSDIRNEPNFC